MDFEYSYHIAYAGFCTLCVILFLAMATQINGNLGGRRIIHILYGLIVSCILEALSNGIDKTGAAGLIPYPAWTQWTMGGLDLAATLFVCYFWFLFIDAQSSRGFFSRRRMYIIMLLPLLFDLACIGLSYTSGCLFFIDADTGYQRGPFYAIQVISCYFYYFVSIGICFDGFVHGSVVERDLFRQLFLYSLLPVVGGLMQVWSNILPFTTATVLISVFYTFIRLQNQRINTDAMTGLNNKLTTQRYIEQMAASASRQPFYLFMFDINYFKQVNDSYGHLTGDLAILIVADALRRTAKKYGGFVGRFGGDEFTAAVRADHIKSPEDFEQCINQNMKKLMEKRYLHLPLSVSAGYTAAMQSGEKVDAIFERADRMLYEKKRAREREEKGWEF